MSLEKTIQNDIKAAMLAREKSRLQGLQEIKAQILLAKTAVGAKLNSDGELDDSDILKIIQKLVKQHAESATIYKENGRDDLATEELSQSEAMKGYLPAVLSEEELSAEISKIVASVGATGPQDMGKVMGVASKLLAGRAEGRAIAEAVKNALAKL